MANHLGRLEQTPRHPHRNPGRGSVEMWVKTSAFRVDLHAGLPQGVAWEGATLGCNTEPPSGFGLVVSRIAGALGDLFAAALAKEGGWMKLSLSIQEKASIKANPSIHRLIILI